MPRTRHCGLALAIWLLATATAWADPFTYLSREAWNGAVGVQVIDDYTDPGYAAGDVWNFAGLDIHSDAHMSAVRGETNYRATAFPNANLTFDESYCAGCNGSFEVSFDTTSLTAGGGVYGVGFNFEVADNGGKFNGFTAFATLADGTTYNLATRPDSGFVGFTSSTSAIRSIHLGRPNGGREFFAPVRLLDLAIAAAPAPGDLTAAPEPGTLLLFGGGLAFLAALRARR